MQSNLLDQLPIQYRSKDAFAALFDHTLLKPEATKDQIRSLCHDAVEHGFKGVCINPCYVSFARQCLQNAQDKQKPLLVSVVGFPLGAHRTDIKIDETLRAIGDGAQEIDMVINAGLYLGADGSAVRHDIAAVVRAAGRIPVKVILETGLLSVDQICEVTFWCADAGAAFVKTSTGFGPRGASIQDIEVMRDSLSKWQSLAKGPGETQGIGRPVEIKASGGIKTLSAAVALVKAGATRLGASASVTLLKELTELL